MISSRYFIMAWCIWFSCNQTQTNVLVDCYFATMDATKLMKLKLEKLLLANPTRKKKEKILPFYQTLPITLLVSYYISFHNEC